MLNMNALAQELADNEIRINNVVVGRLTDTQATQLLDIIHGMMGNASGNVVATPKTGLVFEEDLPKTAKPRTISAPTDVTVTLEGKDNAVWYSATSQDVRTIVNAQLKTAGFIYDKDAERPDTYKVDYTGKDGVKHLKGEHKKGAWVLMKGSKRDIAGTKSYIGKTITVTAAERQEIRDKWEAKKRG